MFNLDQVDRPGQEEFIWAMRSRNLSEDDQWRERRFCESITNTLQLSASPICDSEKRMDTWIKLISSFLPDEILSDPMNFNDRIYDAAVARGSMTGLQTLWDKYRAIGKGGALRMGQALNNYVGNIMQEALVYNGDVIKCNGSNFTIMWKQGIRSMSDCVHQAVDCALGIVKSFANFSNDVNVDVTVVLSVSCGSVIFSAIGTPKHATYVLTGDPLEDTKESIRKLQANQVVVDQTAWEQLNSIEYVAKVFDDEYYLYLIQDYSTAWRSIHDVEEKPILSQFSEGEISETPASNESISQIAARRKLHEIYKLRPSIADAVTLQNYVALKHFIFPPLINIIEADEPIESLMEMRYMVVMIAGFTFEAQNYYQMIKLAEVSYKMINNILEPYNGYVQRLTHAENEMIFYCLFGIHGNRDSYDSSNALKAAMKCFKGSESASYINSLSMSVVSGWCFCGPIGHNMRRDFMLIGSNIAKAHRMIEVYPNKVTCDIETFLKSKFDARHFILQEQRTADAPDLGCVYEYVEPDTSNRLPKYYLNKYPILDRDHEIEVFKAMVHQISKRHKHAELQRYRQCYEPSGLFFLAELRSGKTRLMDELINMTPTDLPMFRLRLNHLDRSVPYQTIYYFFGVPLGIAENSTIADREAKLRSMLRDLPLNGLECILNVIFRVNFPKVPVFSSMKKFEMRVIMHNVIKFLCKICFTKPWVVFIDNAEYIDAESWDVLYSILEVHLVLVVVAIGCSRDALPTIAQSVLAQTKCRCVPLLPIDKLYHTTLVCQMLNVVAIPIQLEKCFHDHSNGVPGWFENFLLALIHHNIICVRQMDHPSFTTHKHLMSLPIKEKMFRDTWKLPANVNLKHTGIIQPALILHRKKWEVFQVVSTIDAEHEYVFIKESDADGMHSGSETSPHSGTPPKTASGNSSNSALNNVTRVRKRTASKEALHRRQTKMNSSASKDMYDPDDKKASNICLLTPDGEGMLNSFDIETVSHYECVKIMDSLPSFEMMLLKVASVIGDFFLRDMLMFVMAVNDEVEVARACEHLFDLRIIACAEGDFRRSLMNYAPLMSDRYNTFDDTMVQCNCVGFLISESCREFKRYANCGFMRFVNEHFRLAVYSLLTTTQLNDMHTMALNFLEKSTRKCMSCGGGAFTKILGNKYEEGVLAERRERRTSSGAEHGAKTSASILEYWDYVGGHTISVGHSSGFRRFERSPSRVPTRSASGIIFKAFSKYGLTGEKSKLPPTYDDSDFTCCECDKILRCMYHHIRYHYEVTENYEKWLHATLEYAVLCTEDSNVAMSLRCLNHALEVIQGPYKEIANPGEAWKHNVMKARVLAEIGRARSMIGQSRLAYEAFAKALHYYGYKLPKASSLRYRLMDLWENVRITTKWRRGIGSKFGYVAEFCDSLSHCLAMMTQLFISLDMWDNAYIAALWSLKKTLQSEKNFIILIDAFTNLLYVSVRMRKFAIIDPLEVMALDYCRRYKCNIDVDDLKSIAYLYSAIFYARLQRAHFEDAFTIGVALDTMTDMLHLRDLLIVLFPLFFEMLLIRADVNDLVNALANFEQVTAFANDYIGDVWFYAQAVYFQLQTGCLLAKISDCEDYYYLQNKRLINFKEPDAERRFFVVIWLWYIRTGNYVIADIWEEKLPETWVIDQYDSINNLITTLLYVEGLIDLVTYKMDRKMFFIIETINSKIESLIRTLEAHAERVKIIAPRLYHLKAYFYMCRMEEYKGWEALDKAVKLAQSAGNIFDLAWAKHSDRAWKQCMPETERMSWVEHANIQLMDYREIESNSYKMFFYTLEMPMYL